jgi:redox-sensitive bicupin YhaK (pirin superfamily)
VYAAKLLAGERISYEPGPARYVWVHVARGDVQLNGEKLSAGDGAAVSGERALTLQGTGSGEVLLFDLP